MCLFSNFYETDVAKYAKKPTNICATILATQNSAYISRILSTLIFQQNENVEFNFVGCFTFILLFEYFWNLYTFPSGGKVGEKNLYDQGHRP